MKRFIFFPLLLLTGFVASGQQAYLDSLHTKLNSDAEGIVTVDVLSELATYYAFDQFDSAIIYSLKAITLSKKLNYQYGTFKGLRSLHFAYNCQGNYPKALEASLENFKVAEKIRADYPFAYASVHFFLGVLSREMGNYSTALIQLNQSLAIIKKSDLPEADFFPGFSQLAIVFLKLNQPDSAIWYAEKGYDLSLKSKLWKRFIGLSSTVLADIYTTRGNYEAAKKFYSIGVSQSAMYNNTFFLARSYNRLADLYNRIGYQDSCIYYARVSLQLCQAHNFGEFALDASSLLTKVFEAQKKTDSSYKYIRIMLEAKDSMFSQKKVQEFQKSIFEEEQRKQEIQNEQEVFRNRVKTYFLMAGMAVLLIIAFLLWFNNRQKQKANFKIEKAYTQLKATQAHLIQSEKMASLGELTAGIAHEIQNPLNFVNNFSEVSNEMIEEMKSELAMGNLQLATEIVGDIKQNLEKINHHGKRADAIVKGMLQHSRQSTGVKEPTDINVLAEEYLRLAYQGFRGKAKSDDASKLFNATLITNFDNSIGKINIIRQDIGRVLLNLLNNAFYSVNEKKTLRQAQGNEYEPTVSVSTKKVGDKILICVKDNGSGISQKIQDKVFQPFFTTKPTGQGTGLGLSLSYDIIKAHGGDIKFDSVEEKYTVFTLLLQDGDV